MPTAAELISAAEAAETTKEIDEIEAQAEGRVTVLDAVEQARSRVFLATSEKAAPAAAPAESPAEQDYFGHSAPPDYVWIGCNSCWTPKDWMRPVQAYNVYLTDGYRRLVYTCTGCRQEMFPTTWGMWIEDAHPWAEGAIAPEASEVAHWGV